MIRRFWWPLKFIWQFRTIIALGAVFRVLFAAWATPPARSPGDPVRATDYDTYIKDNLIYLFSGRPNQEVFRNNSASYTTTSATFVDVDATNVIVTLTVGSGKVLIIFRGATIVNAGRGFFDVTVDGTRIGASSNDGLGSAATPFASAASGGCGFAVIKTGLSVGSHTFKLQWRCSNGTLTLAAGSATTEQGSFVGFEVTEIG